MFMRGVEESPRPELVAPADGKGEGRTIGINKGWATIRDDHRGSVCTRQTCVVLY